MNLDSIASLQVADFNPSNPGRPKGHAEHMPYLCPHSGRVCIDRLPNTQEEVRACGDALVAFYNAQMENV